MPGPFPYVSLPIHGSVPAPRCTITIVWRRRSETVPALLDSGCSCTVIPQTIVSRLSLRKIKNVQLNVATGTSGSYSQYVADIQFLGFVLPSFPVISLPKSYALIGRDILNRYTTTLDGPRLEFSIV